MPIRPAARPYLLAAVLVLVVAGVLVVVRPGTAPSPDPVVAGVGAGDPYYPTDGNSGYDVTDYDLAITYDPATRRLDGQARITARATSDLSRFNLDLQGLQVDEVTVADQHATFTREGEHELVITPAFPLPTGRQFTTTVLYTGEPNAIDDAALGKNGWQRSTTGGSYAVGEPHTATTWFPANDTPRDKARFRLVARVPDGWTVISNGVEEKSSSADGWTTFRWSEQTPIATYLTTVAIDRWTVVRSRLADGTPVLDAYAPGAEAKRPLEQRLPEILALLAEKFGPYPQRAAGGIFLADNIGFSMETQTRPTYALWADLETLVHENAHQWFGDSLTVANWADICLNECFASYAQWLWKEAKEGKDLDALYRDEITKRQTDTKYWSRKLYDMGQGHEFEGVYDKGILATHALRRQIGDPAFDRALKEWMSAHRDGNASWPEFEAHAEKISGQDLDGFFAAWFRGDRLPADEYLWPGPLHR